MTMNKYLCPLLVNTLKKLLGIRSPSAMFEVDAEIIDAVLAENDLHEKLDVHSEENAFWVKLAVADTTKR